MNGVVLRGYSENCSLLLFNKVKIYGNNEYRYLNELS